MSLKVKEILSLPSLREAKLIAGASAKENIVNSISVLESTDPALLHDVYFHHEKFRTDEILITGFINTIHDIKSQCDCIAGLHEAGASGLIIFYVGVFLPRIDQSLIDLANKLEFPLICMPRDIVILYGEVITDVLEAVFQEKKQDSYLVVEVLERVSKLQKAQRTLEHLLYIISNQIHCSIALVDHEKNIIHSSTWPSSNTGLFSDSSIFKMMQETDGLEEQLFEIKSGYLVHYSLSRVLLKYSPAKTLVTISESGPIGRSNIAQLTEIVKIFTSVWGERQEHQRMSELVQAIINDEPIKVRKLADIFKISLSDLQIMLVCSVGKELEEREALNCVSTTQKIIEEYGLRSICDIFDEKIVAFIKRPSYSFEPSHLAQSIISKMKDQDNRVVIAVQPKLSDMAQAREFFRLFSQYSNCAQKIFPLKTSFTFQELLFSEICQKVVEQGEDTVQQHLAPLFSRYPEDRQWQQDLINTLCIFLLDAQGSVVQTSELIHLHRSTVKYRIKLINEAFGYNIQKMPESYSLYLAVAINRLLDQD